MVAKGSQVVGGQDGNSCEEQGEGGHQGPAAAPWVHCVAVVRVTPGLVSAANKNQIANLHFVDILMELSAGPKGSLFETCIAATSFPDSDILHSICLANIGYVPMKSRYITPISRPPTFCTFSCALNTPRVPLPWCTKALKTGGHLAAAVGCSDRSSPRVHRVAVVRVTPRLVNMASESIFVNIIMELKAGVVIRKAAITDPESHLSAIYLRG